MSVREKPSTLLGHTAHAHICFLLHLVHAVVAVFVAIALKFINTQNAVGNIYIFCLDSVVPGSFFGCMCRLSAEHIGLACERVRQRLSEGEERERETKRGTLGIRWAVCVFFFVAFILGSHCRLRLCAYEAQMCDASAGTISAECVWHWHWFAVFVRTFSSFYWLDCRLGFEHSNRMHIPRLFDTIFGCILIFERKKSGCGHTMW